MPRANEVDVIPKWLTGTAFLLYGARVDEIDQRDSHRSGGSIGRPTRRRRTREDALAVALAELLDEWEQF